MRDPFAGTAWIASLRCCVCGGRPPSHRHHVRSRGAGGGPEDVVPLCPVHHAEVHQLGRRTFENRHAVDLAAIAASLAERSRHATPA